MSSRPSGPLKQTRIARIRHMVLQPLETIRTRYRRFWKSTGLHFFTFTSGEEAPKELFTKSRWAALARCGVHILPALVSIVLITLNLYGLYIGFELQGPRKTDSIKLGVLQVTAKIQELLIVASSSEIILHWVRWQLVYGDGLPLGLIGSGFTFSQLSFFWSPDFLASVRYKSSSRVKKAAFIALIVTAGLFAALAGPATAILMIPREMEWPVGGSIFWLNGNPRSRGVSEHQQMTERPDSPFELPRLYTYTGTEAQLWPASISADSLAGYQCDTQDKQLYDARCPSAGYLSIFQHFANWNNRNPTRKTSFEIADAQIRKTFNCTFSSSAIGRSVDTWAVTAHTPTAVMTDIMARLYQDSLHLLAQNDPYRKPGAKYLSSAQTRTYTVSTKAPAVRTVCYRTPKRFNLNDSISLPFVMTPMDRTILDGTNIYYYIERDVTAEVRGRLSTLLGNSSRSSLEKHISVMPVDSMLDLAANQTSSLGLILTSRANTDSEGWAAVTCQIDARWAPGSTIVKHDNMAYLYDYAADRGSALIETALTEEDFGWGGWQQPGNESWSQIHIDKSWFEILTPKVPAMGARMLQQMEGNRTTIENVLSLLFPDSNDPVKRAGFSSTLDLDSATFDAIEHMISVVVADGISRSGTYYNMNYTAQALEPLVKGGYTGVTEDIAHEIIRAGEAPPDREPFNLRPNQHYTKLVMQANYRGWVMTTQSWFDWYCIVLLFLHCLLAIGHTLMTCIKGVTSEAWDTVSELTALAMVSPAPEDKLTNCCAGIRKVSTLVQTARVEAIAKNDATQGGSEQLRLRFFELGEKRNQNMQAMEDMQYGQLKSSSP